MEGKEEEEEEKEEEKEEEEEEEALQTVLHQRAGGIVMVLIEEVKAKKGKARLEVQATRRGRKSKVEMREKVMLPSCHTRRGEERARATAPSQHLFRAQKSRGKLGSSPRTLRGRRGKKRE